MSEVIIKIKNLTKDYGQGRGIFDMNLSVQKNEVFGFIGTNGSGKTTTIRNLMGFIKPDNGESSVNGLNSWEASATIMQNVSYVPGEIAFPSFATGTDFLKSQADYLGVKDFSYMNHIIELLQLDPTANLKRMSKGMKQKTAIVAALMGKKEILVLDEPTTGLDPLMRDSFLELIQEEKSQGHTIFMSSHIFEEIEQVCDKVAMIKDGHIINTLSLYDLRHPTEKHFIIEFADMEGKQIFLTHFNKIVLNESKNSLEVCLPLGEINHLLFSVKDCHITNFQEQHLSLQKCFMNTYKKEGHKYGEN